MFGVSFAVKKRPRRVHPCLCGYMPPTLAMQAHHRVQCKVWKARANADGLALTRLKIPSKSRPEPLFCPQCGNIINHAGPECLEEPRAKDKWLPVVRAGLDPAQFELFLLALLLKHLQKKLSEHK